MSIAPVLKQDRGTATMMMMNDVGDDDGDDDDGRMHAWIHPTEVQMFRHCFGTLALLPWLPGCSTLGPNGLGAPNWAHMAQVGPTLA